MSDKIDVVNAPERIYLQIDPSDNDAARDLSVVDWESVTWCRDRIGNSDLEYRLVKWPRRKKKR